MALTLILELPNATDAKYAIWPEERIATFQSEYPIHVIPLAGPIVPPQVVDAEEAEPTWEDAAWQ